MTERPHQVEAARAVAFQAGVDSVEARMSQAAARLSSSAAHKVATMAGSAHPCQVAECNLSQEEHHRLAYGILAENADLKRRIEALEHGTQEVTS